MVNFILRQLNPELWESYMQSMFHLDALISTFCWKKKNQQLYKKNTIYKVFVFVLYAVNMMLLCWYVNSASYLT